MDKKKRRKYSTEFKREAVALAGHPGQTIAGVAEDLGVGANLLGRWKRELSEHGQQAFVGQGIARDERNLSTTLRHSPLQFTVQDLLSLDWVG